MTDNITTAQADSQPEPSDQPDDLEGRLWAVMFDALSNSEMEAVAALRECGALRPLTRAMRDAVGLVSAVAARIDAHEPSDHDEEDQGNGDASEPELQQRMPGTLDAVMRAADEVSERRDH